MRRSMNKTAAAVLISGTIALTAQGAMAASRSVGRDATDNRLDFEYDASTGTVTERSSYRRASRDAVRFEVGVVEADGYGSGLNGKLRLRLEGDRAVTYDGWFEITITDESGEVAYREARPATIQLKPRPGHRKAAISYRLDLPSGDYEASGSFEQDTE